MASLFWDNLIPLRGRTSGQQYAGWKPTKFADTGLGCKLSSSVMIPMPDGTKLQADIYMPKKPGKYPAIVQCSAYNYTTFTSGIPKGSNEIGSPPIITDRGYVQVIINRRGSGKSEGKFDHFLSKQEILDYKDCIEWATVQSWCNGDICTFGTSYYGISQLLVALLKPKGLKALFMNEICTDLFRDLVYYGETFNNEFFSLWMGGNFKNNDIKKQMSPIVRAILSHIINRPWVWNWFLKKKIDKIYNQFMGTEVNKKALEWFCKIMLELKNGSNEGVISDGSYKNLADIDLPFAVVQNTGMWNIHQFGSYDLFEKASTPKNKKFLIISKPEYELPVLSWQLEALAFFDYFVKKIDNGYENQSPVRYWLEGKNEFERADSFPITKAHKSKFYLHKESAKGMLIEKAPMNNKNSHWAAVPLGAKILPLTEEAIPHILTYYLEPRENLKIVGPIKFNLKFSCNEIDSYIVAKLSHKHSDGKINILGMGAMRPAIRKINSSLSNNCELVHDIKTIEPLKPNEIVTLTFSITPIAIYIKPGESLILTMASRTDLIKGKISDGYVHLDLAVPPYFSKNTIYYGQETYLEVEIID